MHWLVKKELIIPGHLSITIMREKSPAVQTSRQGIYTPRQVSQGIYVVTGGIKLARQARTEPANNDNTEHYPISYSLIPENGDTAKFNARHPTFPSLLHTAASLHPDEWAAVRFRQPKDSETPDAEYRHGWGPNDHRGRRTKVPPIWAGPLSA